jgi:hypothetical protein
MALRPESLETPGLDNVESLTSHSPRPPRPVTGIALPFYLLSSADEESPCGHSI